MEHFIVDAIENREPRLNHAVVETGQPIQPIQNSELIQAVRAVNASELFGERSELTFVIDRRSRKALVRIVDKESGEVVRQFPPEYVLALSEELKALMEGPDSADLRFGRS
ncbi:MAG: flagellar protein FlaG [Bryobacterales bacterium]|nr:flagellar protein FlaG [Bryobacterales bacterium]